MESVDTESNDAKRQLIASSKFIYKRIQLKHPFATAAPPQPPPTLDPTQIAVRRRFLLDQASAIKYPRNVAKHLPRPTAVFIEEPSTQPQPQPPNDTTSLPPPETSSPRKRPGAPRNHVAEPRTSIPPATEDEHLVDALQAYAAELAPRAADPSAMDTADDEYVYDTFIRQEADADSDTTSMAEDAGQTGYLVVPAADADFWKDDQISDGSDTADWDSEQDDENAENYYGADYPEEEMDSEDERGGGAYGRYEDEEFGSEDAWSADDERQPWERPRKVQRLVLEDVDSD